jgi:hypothetical protein
LRLLRRAEVDRAVLWALLSNAASLVLGPVTAWLVATRFSSELQGFYYAFGSLLTIRLLAEVGLGQAIVQFASHEWAHLSLNERGFIVGDSRAFHRLLALWRGSMRWYLIGGAALLVLLVIGGHFFFASSSNTTDIAWERPWIIVCVITTLNFLTIPLFSFLQGCNQVGPFWFYRFVQQVINGLSLWLAIALGWDLWTVVFAQLTLLLWSLAFALYRYPNFIRSLLSKSPVTDTVAWRAEVWPVQWRVAATWMSGNFTTQMLVPIFFRTVGPVAAGQLGITVTLGNVLTAAASNWIVTKAPSFGMLIATRRYRELDQRFRRAMIVSTLFAAVMAALLLTLIWLLGILRPALAERVLPLPAAAVLLLGAVLNAILTGIAVYLRAHKKEPLVLVYLLGTGATFLAAALLTPVIGVIGTLGLYTAIIGLFQLPMSWHIYKRSRVEWHRLGSPG